MVNNQITFGFGQLGRYIEYLSTIKDRHEQAQQNFFNNIEALRPPADQTPGDPQPKITGTIRAAFKESHRISMLLHLEQESYLHFAYPMLLTVAQTIEWFFGSERHCSFSTHRRWVKSMVHYCNAKSLEVPETLFETARRCLAEINDPRDHAVAHAWNPRAMQGTTFHWSGRTTRTTSHMYPQGRDQQTDLPEIEDAHKLLSEYIFGLIQLVRDNRQQSVFSEHLATSDSPGDPQ